MPRFVSFITLPDPRKLRHLIELRELTIRRYRRSYQNVVSLSQRFNEPSFFVGREFPDSFISEIREKSEDLKAMIASMYSQSIRRLETTSNELAPGTFDTDLSESFDWDDWLNSFNKLNNLLDTMANAVEDGDVSQEEMGGIRDAADAHQESLEDVYSP